MLAKTVNLPTKYPIDVGEALGLLHAIQWLSDMQFDTVDFRVDSKVTTDAFNSPHYNVTEFGHVITTCQNLFPSAFTNSSVEFTRRRANVTAHILAMEATVSTSLIVYFVIPECINYVIINEML